MRATTLGKGADWIARAAENVTLKRMLDEEEVASLAIYMVGNRSGLLTGPLVDFEQIVIGSCPL